MPWLRWLLSAFAIAFSVLFVVYLLRDQPMPHAFSEALKWGLISAWAFVLGQVQRVRRKRQCALCEAFARD